MKKTIKKKASTKKLAPSHKAASKAKPAKAKASSKAKAPSKNTVIKAKSTPKPTTSAVKKPVTDKSAPKAQKPAKPVEKPVAKTPPQATAKPVKTAQPQSAKPVAAASSAASSAPAAPKKPSFKVNEQIVYPAHGVGRVIAIEEQEIAGVKLELYIVDFDREKLRLKVPTNRAEQKGMRRLADRALIDHAMKVVRGRARIKRIMWSRRAQEYDAKINSGDLIAVAEVVRDLYRSERQPEQSYSERQLFEQALLRMARELAAVRKIDDEQSVRELTDYLARNAKRAAADKAEDANSAEEAA